MKSMNPAANVRKKLREYTTTDIMKLGIKRERLKDWMERNFITPSIQKASGQGTKNIFSIYDLYTIKLFEFLVENGFSREDAGLRIKWLTMLLRGQEDSFWEYTPFLVAIRISGEQDPIIKRFFHSGRKSAEALTRNLENLPKREYKMSLGSFVLLPIIYQDDERAKDGLGICGNDFISINRAVANDADSLTVVNLEKMVAEIDKIVN